MRIFIQYFLAHVLLLILLLIPDLIQIWRKCNPRAFLAVDDELDEIAGIKSARDLLLDGSTFEPIAGSFPLPFAGVVLDFLEGDVVAIVFVAPFVFSSLKSSS